MSATRSHLTAIDTAASSTVPATIMGDCGAEVINVESLDNDVRDAGPPRSS